MAQANRRRRIIARTLWQALPTMLGVVVLNFFLLKLTPGDAADMLAAQSGTATAETMAQWREIYGLDQPLHQQLWSYLSNLAQLDLGLSPRYQVPVLDLILDALPATLLLMGVAISLAMVVGALLGTLMALSAGSWIDRLLSVLVLLIYSVPGFWIGLMLIVLFSITLGWLPAGGLSSTAAGLSGLSWLTTMAGVHFSALFGGGVVIETVFSWPGLGRLAYDSVMARDFNVLLGVFLLSSLLVIVVNLAVDLLQTWLDPRIKV